MENKLKLELDALPVPATTFEELEAAPKPKTFRRKKIVVLVAAVLALLLCGMGWAKTQFGMWRLYDSRAWSDLEAEAGKHDIRLPDKLDGIPFLEFSVWGHVPEGAPYTQALTNPLYKPVSVCYGYEMRETETYPDGSLQAEYVWTEEVLGLNFGSTENELWRYYFQFDENGIWTACNVPESYAVIEYKGITLQVGDTVWHYESEGRTVYTRWVHWVDEEREVAFSLNETDYTDPNRVVECAKAIIDLNK